MSQDKPYGFDEFAKYVPCARCAELNCAMSWAGNNVHGNSQSINAVKEAVHYAGQVPELKDRIAEQQAKITEQVAEIERLNAWASRFKEETEINAKQAKRIKELESGFSPELSVAMGLVKSQQTKLAKADAVILQAGTALQEVQDLISESSGVYGLHLNGDCSPWNEIEQGGRFERLCTLIEALAAIEQYQKGEEV